MDFKEELKNYVKRIENTKDTLQTEEATKMALILPFFNCSDMTYLIPQSFVQSMLPISESKKVKK